MNPQHKGRLQLILLVLVFALPVVAVVVLHWADWRPSGKSYGELIKPPRTLNFPVLNTARHQPFTAAEWQGKWHMVYVSGRNCAASCRKDIHTMRQLHASLAKEIERLQRVWLIDGKIAQEEIDPVQHEYPDLVILPEASALIVQFNLQNVPAADSGRIYLVDPLGHLIMNYPQNTDPYRMRKDLMRLLAYSWAG